MNSTPVRLRPQTLDLLLLVPATDLFGWSWGDCERKNLKFYFDWSLGKFLGKPGPGRCLRHAYQVCIEKQRYSCDGLIMLNIVGALNLNSFKATSQIGLWTRRNLKIIQRFKTIFYSRLRLLFGKLPINIGKLSVRADCQKTTNYRKAKLHGPRSNGSSCRVGGQTNNRQTNGTVGNIYGLFSTKSAWSKWR